MSQNVSRKVYTVAEVAVMLGISNSYAYELVKQRKVPVLSLGNKRVIPKEQFDTWLKEGSQ